MHSADSTARIPGLAQEAIVRTLEKLAKKDNARASGFYPVVDEFVGLDALERAELDETDDD